MKFSPIVLGFAMLAGVPVAAEEVEVSSVRFNNVRAPGGGTGNWFEGDIALTVRPAAGLMVSRVHVTLTIGCELPALGSAERRVEYYRSEAECVALESGRSDVRFYLPPELVKRDQLSGEPKFWVVAVVAGGRPQMLGRTSVSTTLVTPDARRNFESRAASAITGNEGVLLPQFLTPFAGEYPRATPSFVRRELR